MLKRANVIWQGFSFKLENEYVKISENAKDTETESNQRLDA